MIMQEVFISRKSCNTCENAVKSKMYAPLHIFKTVQQAQDCSAFQADSGPRDLCLTPLLFGFPNLSVSVPFRPSTVVVATKYLWNCICFHHVQLIVEFHSNCFDLLSSSICILFYFNKSLSAINTSIKLRAQIIQCVMKKIARVCCCALNLH